MKLKQIDVWNSYDYVSSKASCSDSIVVIIKQKWKSKFHYRLRNTLLYVAMVLIYLSQARVHKRQFEFLLLIGKTYIKFQTSLFCIQQSNWEYCFQPAVIGENIRFFDPVISYALNITSITRTSRQGFKVPAKTNISV